MGDENVSPPFEMGLKGDKNNLFNIGTPYLVPFKLSDKIVFGSTYIKLTSVYELRDEREGRGNILISALWF